MLKQTPRCRAPHFYKGDIVEVRSESEILATLDSQGTLKGIPFMPEMGKFCGRRFRVLGRLEKVYLDGRRYIGRLADTVMLDEVRCDGTAHGGCQVGCLVLWKEAWLRAGQGEPNPPPVKLLPIVTAPPTCGGEGKFSCQATELVHAVVRISPLALWRYAREYFWGERSLGQLLKMASLMAVNKVRRRLRLPLYGSTRGHLEKTPEITLNLQPGDMVRVKSREEIRATLDHLGRNRGLVFLPDMVRFCGQTFRVARRMERAVMDLTGEMRQLHNTVALETVHCSGISLGACGRRCYHLWREAWLEKVDPQSSAAP
jgi:hypothetical protein